MNVIRLFKVFRLKRQTEEAVEEYKLAGYDWKRSVWKAVRDVGTTVGVVAGTAVLAHFSNPEAVNKLLAEVPGGLLFAPVVQGLIVLARDYFKHRNA